MNSYFKTFSFPLGGPKNVLIAKVMMKEFIKSRIGFGIDEIEVMLGESVDPVMLEQVNDFGVDAAVNWFYNNFISVATPEELRTITSKLARTKFESVAPRETEQHAELLDFNKILQNHNGLEVLTSGKVGGPDY